MPFFLVAHSLEPLFLFVKMPGTRCCVSMCNNAATKTRYENYGVKYYGFPKNLIIRKQWVQFCERGKDWVPNFNSISMCSDHFRPEDHERDLQAELLNLRSTRKRSLKSTAVPSRKTVGLQTTDASEELKNKNRKGKGCKRVSKKYVFFKHKELFIVYYQNWIERPN